MKSFIALAFLLSLLAAELSYAYAEHLLSFDGQMDFAGKKGNINLRFKDNSSVSIQLEKVAEGKLELHTTIEHLATPIFEISSVFKSTIERASEEGESYLRGSLESQYSLIDYKPAQELSGAFEIRKDRLYVKNLSWSGFNLEGYLGLLPPYEINLSLRLLDIPAEDLSALAGCRENESKLEGTVSGRIGFSGFPDRVLLTGNLKAFDGAIDNLAYENIIINFDGMYPVINISQSSVTEGSGLSFDIEGSLDLRYHCNLMTGLMAMKISPIINEDVLHREWTIKRSKDSDVSATEFKYRLQKDREGSGPSKDSDILSVEHKISF